MILTQTTPPRRFQNVEIVIKSKIDWNQANSNSNGLDVAIQTCKRLLLIVVSREKLCHGTTLDSLLNVWRRLYTTLDMVLQVLKKDHQITLYNTLIASGKSNASFESTFLEKKDYRMTWFERNKDIFSYLKVFRNCLEPRFHHFFTWSTSSDLIKIKLEVFQ